MWLSIPGLFQTTVVPATTLLVVGENLVPRTFTDVGAAEAAPIVANTTSRTVKITIHFFNPITPFRSPVAGV